MYVCTRVSRLICRFEPIWKINIYIADSTDSFNCDLSYRYFKTETKKEVQWLFF